MEEYGKPIGKSTVSYNEFENDEFGKSSLVEPSLNIHN
jgi:hypothetical protein